MSIAQERLSDCLLLRSEYGTTRLEPWSPRVVRVTSTDREAFSQTPSRIVVGCKQACEWETRETEREFILSTGELEVRADKLTGALAYYDAQGCLLACEPARGGRTLEEIDVVRTVYDGAAKVETAVGIDGVKATVQGGRQVADRKAYHSKLEFAWAEGEALYGLGSHEEGMMNLRGRHQYLYQENMKAVVPMLLSTKGYGVLLDCQSLMTFHDDAFGSYLWCDVVDELDYYFITGPGFDDVIRRYRELTGPAPMLPRWAFGYMQSKERYVSQQELIDVASEYRRRGIGLDTIVLDWQSWTGNLWGQKTMDPERFPDPDALTKTLHGMGVRLMVSIWPNMSNGGANQMEFLEHGLMLGDKTHYDPFRAEGRELYWKQANEGLFRHGVDAWWCDCSEPFEADWRGTVKPEPEERMRINTEEAKRYLDPSEINSYSLLHSQGIYEGQRAATMEKRVVNLTRSSYAGQHRYSTITWSGDISANWETLKSQIPAGLNFCAAGEPYWTVDIGAFFVSGRGKRFFRGGDKPFPVPWFIAGDYEEGVADLGYRELFVRWFQYGAFLPVFRAHGTGTPREVWRFGEPGEPFHDALLKYVRLRYRLLNYIYSAAGAVSHFGSTMLRALAFDFPGDAAAHDIGDQYLFGPALMACPVTQPMYYGPGSAALSGTEKSRRVYLPAGCGWFDFWTGEELSGGQAVKAEAPLDVMPLYVRAGSILPIGPAVQSASENPGAPLELRVYPGRDAEYLLYDDAGDGYGYESGDYSFTKIAWNDAVGELTIEPHSGSRDARREFRAVLASGGQCAGMEEAAGSFPVRYEGVKVSLKLS